MPYTSVHYTPAVLHLPYTVRTLYTCCTTPAVHRPYTVLDLQYTDMPYTVRTLY